MSLRAAILIMSAFGVISDSILIAFYPQFFKARYGLTSPVQVGAYIAAISMVVMAMLPLWARIARRVEILRLLLLTQCAAGLLCLASAWAPNAVSFWVLSLLMYMTKASYLLLFPYLMRLEKPDQHALVVGMLSVVVHVAAIFGSATGGFILQKLGSQTCIALMAAGDFIQMAICGYLVVRDKTSPLPRRLTPKSPTATRQRRPRSLAILFKLSLLMFLFDLSAYLPRPFFTLYWESVSGLHQPLVTGLAFAIPGAVALCALTLKQRWKAAPRFADHTLGNLLLAALGLALQAAPSIPLIVLGRVLYGWALYQVVVKLEVTLFKLSSPEAYERDFAVANFFQQSGALLASFAAGYLVSLMGAPITFAIAAAGMLLTALIDWRIFGVDHYHRHDLGACHAD